MKNVKNFNFSPDMYEELIELEERTGYKVVGMSFFNKAGLPHEAEDISTLELDTFKLADIGVTDWIHAQLADLFYGQDINHVRFYGSELKIVYNKLPSAELVKDCVERLEDESNIIVESFIYKPDNTVLLNLIRD